MFGRIGSFAAKHRIWVILAWVVAAVVMVLFAPPLREAGTMEEASFLPKGTESLHAQELIGRYFPSAEAASTGTLVFHNPEGLSDEDLAYAQQVRGWLLSEEAPEQVESVSSIFDGPQLEQLLISPDNTTMLMQVGFSEVSLEAKVMDAVESIRSHLRSAPPGLEVHVSGEAGISRDFFDSLIEGIDRTTIITVALVIVLLLIMYRSPVASLVPLVTIGIAFLVARGALGYIADAGVKIWSQVDAFIIVLVFGVGTDYCLFMVSRFREELRRLASRFEAIVATVGRIGAAISAAAATTILGLLGMGVGRFEMIRTMGPVLGLSIFITLLAALTLTPALTSLFGRRLFWPFHEELRQGEVRGPTIWAGVARLTTGWPAFTAITIAALLLIPYVALPSLNRSFNTLAEVPQDMDSVAGFRVLEQHYGIGEMMPATALIVPPEGQSLTDPTSLAALAKVSSDLLDVEGVEKVQSVVQPEGLGESPQELTVSGQLLMLREGLTSLTQAGEADSASLFGEDIDNAFGGLAQYLDELSEAFPWVEEESSYQAIGIAIQDLRITFNEIKEGALVENQLRGLSRQISSATESLAEPGKALGGDLAQALAPIQGYLTELGEGYPSVKSDASYQDALKALADIQAIFGQMQLAQSQPMPPEQIQAALAQLQAKLQSLSADLETLASTFAGQDAYLLPESLAQVSDALSPEQALQAQLNNFGRQLEELSSRFQDKGNPYFLPKSLLAFVPEAQDLLNLFFSKDGKATRLYLVLESYPYSPEALNAVDEARSVLSGSLANTALNGAEAALGGPTAEAADVEQVMAEDFNRVMLVVIASIFVVLVVLLRSLVAPVYLLITVLLSYGSTLGIVTWLFQGVLGHEGISYMVPLLVFVLLVALGADYNIFLISRVREESEQRPAREAARLAATATGGVITACGIILAGTFGALGSAPIQTLFQVGVAIAIGILIDTLIVRALLVPAIAALLGRWNWWPMRRISR